MANNFFLGSKLPLFALALVSLFGIHSAHSQLPNTWGQMSNISDSFVVPKITGGGTFDAVAFSINNRGYFIAAKDDAISATIRRSVREYNPDTKSWTSKGNIPSAMSSRHGAVGFSLAGFGYVGLGLDSNSNLLSDFWRYDPVTDTWTPVAASFPGAARYRAVAFVIGSKAYIGTGAGGHTDFYEFDGTNFAAIASLPVALQLASAFAIGGRGYVGNGEIHGGTFQNTFYRYNPITDEWTTLATPFPGGAGWGMPARSIPHTGLGYVIAGSSVYSFNPSTLVWSLLPVKYPDNNSRGVTFVIRDTLYVGGGGPAGATAKSTFYALSGFTEKWTTMDYGTSDALSFKIDEDNYLVSPNGVTHKYSMIFNQWERKSDCPCAASRSAGFELNGKLYVGTGGFNGSRTFCEYDPATDTWTSKASLPLTSPPLYNAVGYSLNGKGYIAGGSCIGCSSYLGNIWEYNTTTNSWVLAGTDAVQSDGKTFYLGNQPYLLHAKSSSQMQLVAPGLGTSLASPPITDAQAYAVFSIANRGYMVTGSTGSTSHNKFLYEYDPVGNHWTQRTDFAGLARNNAVGFSQSNRGFAGTGNIGVSNDLGKDLFEYHPHPLITSPIDTYWVKGGTVLQVPFNAINAPGGGNTYFAQLSDVNGNFSPPTNIGSIASNARTGFINATIPENVQSGLYKIRVTSSAGGGISPDNGAQYLLSPKQASLRFDGVTNYIEVPQGLLLEDMPFTIEFWLQEDAFSDKTIVSIGDNVNPIEISIDNSNRVGFDFDGSPLIYQLPSRDYSPHHWAFVYLGSTAPGDNRKIYYDGNLVASDYTSPTFSATDSIFYIGKSLFGGNFMEGILDELRIWETERTDLEIQADMNCEIAPSTVGLRAYYKFNNGFSGFLSQPASSFICPDEVNARDGALMGFGNPFWSNGYELPLVNSVCVEEITALVSLSTFCENESFDVDFNATGFAPNVGNDYVVELSNASGSFASPTVIGISNSNTATNGNINVIIPSGTAAGSGYRVRVNSTNPAVTGTDNGSNLSIQGIVTPSVTLDASPAGAFCAGTNITFTATPTNGGASPTYNFKVNGSSVQNGSSNTYSTTALTNGQTVTVELTSNAACVSPATVSSSTYTASVTGGSATYYKDTDNDGYSDGTTQLACVAPTGYKLASALTSMAIDCNDNNANIYPGATEICNGIDDNCDGNIDESCTYIWHGHFSEEWNNPNNWIPAGIPNSIIHIVSITSATHPIFNPLVPTGQNITLYRGTVGNSTPLTISAGSTITTFDTFATKIDTPPGINIPAKISGGGTFVMSGAVLSGNMVFEANLMIDNPSGVKLNQGTQVGIENQLQLKSGNLNVTSGKLTFLSPDKDKAGILNDFSSGFTGTITGTVFSQRGHEASTAPSLHSQHYFGSPLSNINVTQLAPAKGTNGVFVTPTTDCDEAKLANNSMTGNVYQYNESAVSSCHLQGWQVRSSGTVQNGKGYSVVKGGSGVLEVTGQLTNVDVSVTGLGRSGWTSTSKQGNQYTSGWHLLSNPFQANLDLDYAANSDFENFVMVMHTHGQFEGTLQPMSMSGSGVLAPFQGFFARKATTGGTATFTMNKANRTVVSTAFHKTDEHQIGLKVAGNGFADITYFNFNPNSTDGFDPEFDAGKFSSAAGRPTIYSFIGSDWASVNTTPFPYSGGEIKVGFNPGVNGTFEIEPSGVNDMQGVEFLLKDHKLNFYHNLTRNGSYVFDGFTSDSRERFSLAIVSDATGISESKKEAIKIAPNPVRDLLHIILPAPANSTVEIYDSKGALAISKTISQSDVIDVSELPSSVYFIKIKNANGTVSKKFVKE